MTRRSPKADERRDALVEACIPRINQHLDLLIAESAGEVALFLAANFPDQLASTETVQLFTAAKQARDSLSRAIE